MDSGTAEFLALQKQIQGQTGQTLARIQRAKAVYSTGCLGLDAAIGRIDPIFKNGGIPERSIVEIFGVNGAYKSGTLEHLIRSVQQRGKTAVIVYSEEPDFDRMERIGVNIGMPKEVKRGKHKRTIGGLMVINAYQRTANQEERLLLAERALRDAIRASKHEWVGLVGVDSLKGLTSAGQIYDKGNMSAAKERGFDQSETAPRARMMEKFFDRLKVHCKCAIIVIVNQLNESITKDYTIGIDDRPKTSGGRRKEFEALIRIKIDSRDIEEKQEHEIFPFKPQIGLQVVYWLCKNKYSQFTGRRKVEADFMFTTQKFNRAKEILRYAAYLGMIERKGNFYTFPDGHKANGEPRAIKYLKNSSCREMRKELEVEIIQRSNELFSNKKGSSKQKAKSVLAKEFEETSADVVSLRSKKKSNKSKKAA